MRYLNVILSNDLCLLRITEVRSNMTSALYKWYVDSRIVDAAMSIINDCSIITVLGSILRDMNGNNDTEDSDRAYCAAFRNDCAIFRCALDEINRTAVSIAYIARSRSVNYILEITRRMAYNLMSERHADIND